MTSLTTIVDDLIQQANGHGPLVTGTDAHGMILGLGTQHDQVQHTDPAHIDRSVVNQVIDSALGALAGGDMHEHPFAQPERQANFLLKLIPLVLHWIKQQGSLTQALQALRQHGLEAQVDSWVGPGINDRITPDIFNDLIETSAIDTLAQQFGISPATVRTGLAVVLPQLIAILAGPQQDNEREQADIEINNVLTRLAHI